MAWLPKHSSLTTNKKFNEQGEILLYITALMCVNQERAHT